MNGPRRLGCFLHWLVSVKFSSHAWYLLCAQREFSKIIAYFYNPSSPFCCILTTRRFQSRGNFSRNFQSIWLKTLSKNGKIFGSYLGIIFLKKGGVWRNSGKYVCNSIRLFRNTTARMIEKKKKQLIKL